jgi:hypothetical protein
VPAGTSPISNDTFTIRHDRTTPFDALAFVWNVQAQQEEEDEPETGSPGNVTLEGVSETSFNSTAVPVRFTITGATFSINPEDLIVYHNNKPVPANLTHISPSTVSISSVLVDGENSIILVAKDAQGLLVYDEVTLWAGSNTVVGTAFDPNGQPVSGADITARLGDDRNVNTTVTSANGVFQIDNLPTRTIILEASSAGNQFGSAAITGNAGSVQLTLIGFSKPSTIENNDFHLGTEGWNIRTESTVSIIPHQEGSMDTVQALPVTEPSMLSSKSSNLKEERRAKALRLQKEITAKGSEPSFAIQSPDSEAAAADTNQDLQLSTGGIHGAQSISRTFQTKPGTKSVTVRYRFITSEVPGGYFGTEFNDYFSVSVRSQNAGGQIAESNSMNGLGLGAFDPSGATAWRETTLSVNEDGDTVQVDLEVANVEDELFDSLLIVDFVQEKKLAITQLTLNDIDNMPLWHLSTAAHPYFNGNTRIHGTVTVEGASDDELESLVLEIIQGGAVVATAQLSQSVQETLIGPFGDAEKVEITNSQLLFELPSDEAANVNGTQDGTLTLRASAKSTKGEEATKTFETPIHLLVRYTANNRYGPRNGNQGGDDWVKPGLKAIVEHYEGITLSDFSNMNGGNNYPPHSSHRCGNDVDGRFEGYSARDAATAATIIGQLNDSPFGSGILMVFVTYEKKDTNLFWTAIKDVELDDGRRARDVIRDESGHGNHFHWRSTAKPIPACKKPK